MFCWFKLMRINALKGYSKVSKQPLVGVTAKVIHQKTEQGLEFIAQIFLEICLVYLVT